MTDRNKRLEKILKKRGLKGWLKIVDSLENSDFVLIENKRCRDKSIIITTEDYKTKIERDETYSTDVVYFLGITNKRNTQTIKYALFMGSNGIFISN